MIRVVPEYIQSIQLYLVVRDYFLDDYMDDVVKMVAPMTN